MSNRQLIKQRSPDVRRDWWLKLKADVIRDKTLYFCLVPVIAYYILFNYLPLYGLQIGFRDYRPLAGIAGSEWVGLEHFKTFFQGPYAWRVIRNTFMLNLYDICINFTATVVMALLINEIIGKKFKSFVQTTIYMPYFISSVVVAGMFVSMLSPSTGIINLMLAKLGFAKVYFLAEPKYFRFIYTTMVGWQNIGFGTIIYTSAICSIDDSLYEAASIDGASRWKRIWHITLPSITGTITIMLIMKIGSMLSSSAENILLLYQPITYETADVISTYVYRSGIEGTDYSYSTAIGLFNGVVSLILVSISNLISRRVSETSIW